MNLLYRCVEICRDQYAVLNGRVDTSYPTGGYGVSVDLSEHLDTAYGRRVIRRIGNCLYAFSSEELELIRRISFCGYDKKDDKKNDEKGNDDEKKDETGSMETRKKKMQTPIPSPTRSPRKNLSSDKTLSQELTETVQHRLIRTHLKSTFVTNEFFMGKIREVLDHCNNVVPELSFTKKNEMLDDIK
ncbi:hypothetical protein Tco_1083356 [Tanacetum coccineum]